MKEQKREYPSAHDLDGIIYEKALKDLEINTGEVAKVWLQRLTKLTAFFEELSSNVRWQMVLKNFEDQKGKLCDGLFTDEDPRSNIYVAISAFLSDPQMRQAFIQNIDHLTTLETEALLAKAKENGNIISDIDILLVGGTGLHGAIFSVEIQTYNPLLSILAIDKANKRGGGFRSYTESLTEEVAVFDINSHHNQPSKTNLNDIQPNAPAHLEAVTGETFPSQNLLASIIVVNGFMSSPSMQNMFVETIIDLDGGKQTRVDINHNGEQFIIFPKVTIIATGVPKTYIPIAEPNSETGILTKGLSSQLETYLKRQSNDFYL